MQPSKRAESVSQGSCCQHVAMHATPDALLSIPSVLDARYADVLESPGAKVSPDTCAHVII